MFPSFKLLALPVLSLAVGLTGCQSISSPANAAPAQSAVSGLVQTQTQYANQRYLDIVGKDFPLSETSARLLVNSQKNAPELVNDIFDGKGQKAVPGYKIMVINRTSSVAAEARKTDDGKIIDNRMIHRGSKSLIGIPVVNGKAQVAQAQLLDFDIIYDDPAQPVAEDAVVKPRGTKLTKNDVPVTNKQVKVQSLTLPNFVSGENAGGGIVFEASALVNGQPVKTGANSAFQIFYTATPDNARGF
ncbi:hypothetical protein [Psychrobacter pygoscelis]|uniref:hypothetical protein n=1 Tax=Psychrobacter pygoscelis TaxID=2488563 RepID=UPI00103A2ED2|nr:hypothetical protein [Psychrobacter pygoscelis]